MHLIEEDAPYYCYRRNENDGTYTSLYGDALSKQVFETRTDYNKYINNRSGLFESDISPVYKYLSNNFYLNNHDTFVNVGFFDIEVDYDLADGNGYPTPEDPFGEINSISLYDCRNDEYHMIVLHDSVDIDHEEGETLFIHHCVTERQVLDVFFKLIVDIDILSAWNGDKFDIGYIYARCIEVYGEKGLKKMCRDGHRAKWMEKKDDWGNEYVHYTLVGRSHIDYMELYKKFTFGERESYALDSIAEYELKSKKLAYKGDLGDLYRTDPKTFFEYSLHDARLLKQLDDKLKFMELCASVTARATTKFTDVFGSIKNLEHTIINYCHFDREEKLIMPDKGDNKKEKFEGAFVTETVPAAYGWCSSIDLTSLYPSVIRAINISPETHMFQCHKNDKDFVKVVEQSNDTINMIFVPTGEEISMTGMEVFEMLREMNYTISAFGSIFENKLGIIPEVLGLWFGERKDLKAKSKQFYKAGDKAQGDYYDMLQNIRKLYLNSLYGAISNQYSRFYSISLAASVTVTGQQIEKFQMWKADQLVEAA